jgi:hypothetical protein
MGAAQVATENRGYDHCQRSRLAKIVVAAVLVAACSGGSADPPGVTGGKPSDVDLELPVPDVAVKQPAAGAWRISQPPEQVFGYYQDVLPKNGWSTEAASSQLRGPTYILTICRQKQWRTVGINPDRNAAGNTLLSVSTLPDSDDCP